MSGEAPEGGVNIRLCSLDRAHAGLPAVSVDERCDCRYRRHRDSLSVAVDSEKAGSYRGSVHALSSSHAVFAARASADRDDLLAGAQTGEEWWMPLP